MAQNEHHEHPKQQKPSDQQEASAPKQWPPPGFVEVLAKAAIRAAQHRKADKAEKPDGA